MHIRRTLRAFCEARTEDEEHLINTEKKQRGMKQTGREVLEIQKKMHWKVATGIAIRRLLSVEY